ncbi:membrane protein [Bacillus coahuilensis m2-6]|uniref:LrgB family protein n=1 Tax=Bacillus coahuilensis TaxID=408580 RepID=UPI0001850FF8|nr:LrgB family protein [Bacillus coahuilensis]KUP08211.1 membrane protein [Bacillus coahuilensis m2-6]
MNSYVMTIVLMIVTIMSYALSLEIAKKFRYSFTTPLFVATLIIIGIFLLFNISYQDYMIASDIITYLLGPATVAIAVPIYKNRQLFSKYFISAFVGIGIGSIVTIGSAVIFAKVIGLDQSIELSLTLKSMTTPVAVEVAKIIGANIPLSAAFVVVTGIIGAMFGPWIMTIAKISHPISRGLALGVISHGIGTSEAIKEGEVEGAVAGSAMGVTALILAIAIPLIL